MWTTVSDSPHDHEREALAWLKSRLPEREPYNVWTNFEFTTQNGQLYEVDALAVTDNGFHLIEIKSRPGKIEGDSSTWQWTTKDGKFRQFDNPRILANRKAKALKGLIESSPAFRNDRRSVPYLAECVFLSDPKLKTSLNPQGRHNVFGRDTKRGEELPPERAALGGIVDHLVSLDPDPTGRPRKRMQRQVAQKLVKAIGQVGIRERTSRKEVGDYRIAGLLVDVEADTTDGIAYQDFLGKHKSLDIGRRLRIYPLELNATADQREAARRAARREFELLSNLRHRGILQPLDYTEHERGPVLIFDYDPDEVSLAEYLADPSNELLSVEARLSLIRQIAEAVDYANRRGVFHRSLAPSAVLVRPSEDAGDEPRVRITNWHTGARVGDEDTSTPFTGTMHAHIDALAASDTDVFRAPEFSLPNARPAGLDVFSLGALSLFVLTGCKPATSARKLRSTLGNVGYLDPSTVADGVDPRLSDVIMYATSADPAERLASVEDLLGWLDLAEEEWGGEDEVEIHPLEARRGDVLADGRLEVLQRLGRGSTAIALLVKDRDSNGLVCVLKVVEAVDHGDRLLAEAAALDGLHHSAIVSLLDEPLELSGHAAILISYAGLRVDPKVVEPRSGVTLASRMSSGPIGIELAQRWGDDLLDALRYLEQMGRAHRDIKPENLGVAPRGEQKELHLVLFDFSLSDTPIEALEAGTAGYIDPFLDQRGRWDPAADRYAATVTLFEMLTGTKPRYGDGTADPALVAAPPNVAASLFDSAVASGLVTFFMRALQPKSTDRFDTAEDMYRAWHQSFEGAAAPSAPSSHPDGESELVIPAATTLSTPLAGLSLSSRAVSALERSDILTVADLLARPVMQVRSLPGVGARTRGEIREALDLLGDRFTGAAHENFEAIADTVAVAQSQSVVTDQAPTTSAELDPIQLSGSLAVLAQSALPTTRRANQQTQVKLARILIGLEPDRDPWAAQSELARWMGVTRGRVSQVVGELRKRWLKEPFIRALRDQVRGELSGLSVASVGQIASLLVAASHDSGSSAEEIKLARGLVRVASLTEEALAEPGWTTRRYQRSVVLTRQGEDLAGASAHEVTDYAIALAGIVEGIVELSDIVGHRELLAKLHEQTLPAGIRSLPDAHLADLAADLCDTAAVNSRLELYRHGLEPVPALRAARRAFVANETFSPEAIAAKISARFPEASGIPKRPDLDDVLSEAGIGLVWNSRDGVYFNPQYEPLATSVAVNSRSRYETNVGMPAPAIEIDNAAEFERRLTRARNSGGMLVLMTHAQELSKATHQLGRLVDVTVDLDEWIVHQLDDLTASGKPSWERLSTVDAAGEHGPSWEKLQKVVDRALDGLTDRLFAASGTVLITNLGLLARYNRLDLVPKWRDALHAGGQPLQALWLLVPTVAASAVPMLGVDAVPVISRNEWGYIPVDWLRNAHRTGVAQ